MALAVDLGLLVLLTGALIRLGGVPSGVAQPAGLAAFAAYYVVTHRLWGKTLGKRLLRLRIQGTTHPITVPGLALRFTVELWGPLAAALLFGPRLGPHIAMALAAGQVKLQALAVAWLGGFLFACFDVHRQALHDRAARTRVVYELRPRA
jgi:uncharacterized RDD family membrane protein YckC